MNISIERNHFYEGDYQTLLYREQRSHHELHNEQICNCTKAVIEKPEGVCKQITQSIKLHNKLNKNSRLKNGKVYFDISYLFCRFDWVDNDEKHHAYFSFSKKQSSLRIEAYLANYGYVNYFFANLFLGNKIDISCLMNGHSPSKIIDLSKIDSDQVWLHHCSWGKEGLEVIGGDDESDFWRQVFSEVEKIKTMSVFYNLTSVDLDLLHKKVDEDILLKASISKLITYLENIVLDLKETQLFKIGDKLTNYGN